MSSSARRIRGSRDRLGAAADAAAPRCRSAAVEQQHLAGLLRDRPAEMPLDQIGGKSGGAGAAGAGDSRTVGEEEPVGDHFVTGKRLRKSW